MTLTVRGVPYEPNIKSTISFLKNAREKLVICFDESTTDFAHKQWRKR
jgi:hypothetical protein